MGIGRRILQRMAELGIKTNVALAEKMNRKVHPYTIGKWIAGKSVPRGTSVIALAKALKISADLILFDEGENPGQTKELTKMVTEIVKMETKKVLNKVKPNLETALEKFVGSKNIPQEDKDSILRQIENLLKLYPDKEK